MRAGLGAAGAGDEVLPGSDAELAEDMAEVELDGLDANVELGCRLAVPAGAFRPRPVPAITESELSSDHLTVPSPEGSGPAGRLKESGFGIGLRLSLALLPPGARPGISRLLPRRESPAGSPTVTDQTVSVSGSDSPATSEH